MARANGSSIAAVSTSANSAAVAALLDWLAVVHRAGGHLRYEGLPDRVRAIAEISEVEELLETGV